MHLLNVPIAIVLLPELLPTDLARHLLLHLRVLHHMRFENILCLESLRAYATLELTIVGLNVHKEFRLGVADIAAFDTLELMIESSLVILHTDMGMQGFNQQEILPARAHTLLPPTRKGLTIMRLRRAYPTPAFIAGFLQSQMPQIDVFLNVSPDMPTILTQIPPISSGNHFYWAALFVFILHFLFFFF